MGTGISQQFSNAVYGVLDYAAYPVGMLAVAPCILRSLGVAQYGIWAVTSSIVSLGSIVASGFGDANTQLVATQRGEGRSVSQVVRAAMRIHVVLGIGLGLAIFGGAEILANRLCPENNDLRIRCVECIRFGGLLTAVRAVESVCISTQRGFERYSAAVKISIASRLLTLAAAALVSFWGGDVARIMVLSAGIALLALVFQLMQVQRLLGAEQVRASFNSATTGKLLRLGSLTWILAVAGVVFSYADRLVGGATMGAAAVASYALCVQISQPVYGVTAAGLHFLFPYLARTHGKDSRSDRNRTLQFALLANFVFVLAGSGTLLFFRGAILRFLSTDAMAAVCSPLLAPVLAGSALLGLSVTGTYGMLALGQARSVAILNVLAATAAVAVGSSCISSFGVLGIAAARIVFAAVALLVYILLLRELRIKSPRRADFTTQSAVLEDA